MQALDAWMKMGGYAVYVWPAYAAALLLLAVFAALAFRRLRRARLKFPGQNEA